MQKKSYVYRLARLLGGELVLPYDRLVFSRRSVPVKKLANRLLCRVEGGLKAGRPLSYPLALQLEPTIVCQLDCPYCPRVKATAGMKHGHMEWSNYTRLLEEVGHYLGAIAFWQWGEPLLHPRIADMIKLAHSYGIITFMSTNAQFEPGDVDVPALVASGLDMLIISMDGTRQETYEKFRAGGQIERLKRFARAVIEEKKRVHNKDLVINIRIVATSENEAEIEEVRQFAQEAGADIFSVKSVSLYYDDSPDDPRLPVDINLRSYQYRGREEAQRYRRLRNKCRKPWSWPTLRYDGTLLFCECDHRMEARLGNVFQSSFKEVWQGETAQNLRKHFHRNGQIDFEFCQRCRYKIDDAIRIAEEV